MLFVVEDESLKGKCGDEDRVDVESIEEGMGKEFSKVSLVQLVLDQA